MFPQLQQSICGDWLNVKKCERVIQIKQDGSQVVKSEIEKCFDWNIYLVAFAFLLNYTAQSPMPRKISTRKLYNKHFMLDMSSYFATGKIFT